MDERSHQKSEIDTSSDGVRSVVIERGEKGYGLTVSGQSPVIVQEVREGGPAALSGVKKGDSLVSVNDNPVSQVNHKDVVNIIKSTQRVKLTLKTGDPDDIPHEPQHRISHLGSCKLGDARQGKAITSPVPVNLHLQSQFEVNRVKTLLIFLEKQKKVKENIQLELKKDRPTPTKTMQKNLEKEMESVNRQIGKIMEELKNIKDIDTQLPSHPRSSPRSPPLNRNSISHPHAFHPYQTHTRSVSEMPPPPLPARNRSLISQISAPNISVSSFSLQSCPSVTSSNPTTPIQGGSPAPPLPPRPPHLDRSGTGDSTNTLSLESISKGSSLGHSNSSGSDSSSRAQSHHRVKSSPDPVGYQNSPVSVSLSGSDSLGDLSTWSKASPTQGDEDPPGTPPPPYGSSNQIISAEEADENYCTILDDIASPSSNIISNVILAMEEDDGDQMVEDHGPFQSFSKLISMKYNAYLAVFVNYVISNCDPASLFFYMITDLYKEGGPKEMKKWAYEIHSSFLLPGAPMRLSNIDESVLYEIDETLQKELDKEEILRKVFWKARQRSREDLNEQLADFRSKRSAGLGSLFGPPDHALEESVNNKLKEMQIVETLLVPCLDSVSEDLRNQTDQMLIMASSLATILWKYFNVKSQQSQQLLDRCPLFVNKDRPLKSKLLRGNKKHVVRDHHFNLITLYSVNHCNHCGYIIWGIAPQGYQCGNCEMNIHKFCVRQVEEPCVGQVHRSERSRDIKFSFLLKIMPEESRNRKSSHVNPLHIERARRPLEDGDLMGPIFDNEVNSGDKVGSSAPAKEQRKSDPGSSAPCSTGGLSNHVSSQGGIDEERLHSGHDEGDQNQHDASPAHSIETTPNHNSKSGSAPKKKPSSSINRSESCKEKQNARKQARENRKNSDPNIPSSKSGDVDGDNNPLNFHSGSSSSSSLSQSHDSPAGAPTEQIEAYASALENDSDIEADTDLPDWTQRLSPDVIERLHPKERKRQDTINEFFHTEQSHVRVLKVLQYLFHQPLRRCGYVSTDVLDSLFGNLDHMLRLHTGFNKAMKKRRRETPLVLQVGDIMESMFSGDEGQEFQQMTGEYVSCQGFALEIMKQQQKRDQKLSNFLTDQENHPICRRLQLKDMLPSGFQRLTKYPLLLESLLSYTDRSTQTLEYDQLAKALDRSKEILEHVNKMVSEAENKRRLTEIQKHLDQSSLAKNKHENCEELRGELDLTKHILLHEGPLTWKTRGQKNLDLHALILEDYVVLLQKDSDKYVLKYHSISKNLGKDDKLNHSPMIKFGTFIFRPVATNKCAFFIVLTHSTLGHQIYELVTMSSNERNVWLRHLHDAQSAYEAREGGRKQRNPHTMPEAEDGQSDNIRDVEEVDADTSESAEAANDRGKDIADSSAGLSLTNTGTNSVAPSNQSPSSPELLTKKTECSIGGSAGVGSSNPSTTPTSQGPPTRTRRLQEVQIIQIVEGPSLIQPSEVTVSQGVVLSAEPVLTPIELLRRKDLKIRQELEEKQSLIADILNIPREDYESVADMAGEVGMLNKEPRELVLGAIFQATKLQATLNEVQSIKDSDIIAAQACPDPANRGAALSHSQKSLDKLLNISGTLAQLLNSLLSIVSDRDDEREMMLKELKNSRDRLHHLHMKKNSLEESFADNANIADANSTSTQVGVTSSPKQSRPNSYVSVGSSGLEQTEGETTHTDEDCKTEELVKPSVIDSKSHLENDKSEIEVNLSGVTDGSSSAVAQEASSPLTLPQLDEGETT